MQRGTTWARRALAIVTAAVLAGTGLAADTAGAAGSLGQWSRQADMATARYAHRSVALPTGQVLVAGGYHSAPPNVFEATATAEVLDPRTGTSTAVAPMASPRTDFAATLLPDQRVLVAGGRTQNAPNAGAELFDPWTRTWKATTAVPFGNATMAAALGNGEVLVVGGWESHAAAVYAPASEQWTMVSLPTILTANNNSVRALVALADGTALALSADGPAATYSPFTGWSPAGSIEPRHASVVLRMKDGRVLVMGGSYFNDYRRTTWMYQPVNRSWTAGPQLAHPHSGGVGAVLPDGDVLIAGGYSPMTGKVASSELLDMDNFNAGWQPAGSMQFKRSGAAAVTAENGNVLVSGGSDEHAQASVEVFANSDVAPPTISGAPDRQPDVFDWYTTPVTVRFACADATSGVASCSPPVTLSAEGADQFVTGTAADRVGNTATTTVGPLGLDFTAPTTTVDTPLVTVVARPAANGSVSGTATDNVSGILGVRVLFWSQVDGKVFSDQIAAPSECSADGLVCQWSAAVPSSLPPGVYDVTAQAADLASHVDPFGATTRVVVIR